MKSMTRWIVSSFAYASIFLALISHGQANDCTSYEQEVLGLAREADEFHEGERFREWGFAIAGPYSQWLKQLQDLADDPQARSFFAEHGFAVMDIYSIADEYRTEG